MDDGAADQSRELVTNLENIGKHARPDEIEESLPKLHPPRIVLV